MKKNLLFVIISSLFFIFFSCDNDKIQPGFSGDDSSIKRFKPENVTNVVKQDITRMYEAVGTIRPLTEAIIESQVSTKVLKVFIVPGTAVKKGQLLIRLDARKLLTRLKQSKEGLAVAKNNLKQTYKSMDEAKADLDQAKAAYLRTKKLFESNIVTSQKLEIDNSRFLQAKARREKSQALALSAKASIRKANEIVKEAQIAVDYSEITSPASGVVVQRMIDPGDLALPGKPLLIIQTSGALRLEANVREGLISRVILGNDYPVKIKTLKKTISSKIEEIVPYADPATRTFLVKASLPDTPGIYPGMFGRLLIPVEKKTTLMIPKKAVMLVGQLEQVFVKKDNLWQLVYIKTGKSFGEEIEVLSGLIGNETIGYN